MKKLSETKFGTYVSTHKKTSIAGGILVVIILFFVIKSATAAKAQTTYTLGTVDTGTIVSSITGSGQVAANRTIDLKPQASGTITYLPVTAGETVTQGQLIAEIDNTTAEESVRNAEASLENAQISLEKIQEPTDQVTLLQTQTNATQASSSLTKAYTDGFNSVTSAFLDLPSVVTGLDTILHGTDANPSTNQQPNINFYADTAAEYETGSTTGQADQYMTTAQNAYLAAKTAYDKNFTDYKNATLNSSTDSINSLINETYTTSTLIAEAVKDANNLIQYYQDVTTNDGRTPVAKSTSELATLNTYTNTTNSHVSDLSTVKATIVNDIANVAETSASLTKLQAGTDPLDIQSAQLSVTQAENSVQDAKDNLADYYIYAPFNGTIATLTANQGDDAGSGSAIGTIITNDEVATITLNEVDAAKVKVGQRATMTFDAIDGLTMTGKVASVDTVGTVSSGVVNYTVTIAFDTTNDSIKPGMSVDAAIITDTAPNVLIVPTSAVKTANGESYVQTLPDAVTDSTTGAVTSPTAPVDVTVTTGLSDDTDTAITSGLTEGQTIVIKTTAPSTTAKAATTTSATSLLGGGATRGATAGAARGATGGFTRGG